MIERPMYVDRIMAYMDLPFVKILTGVRRCGKSTIAENDKTLVSVYPGQGFLFSVNSIIMKEG